MNRFHIFLILLFISAGARAQDTLPKFSVKNVGNNRIIIGWINNYPRVGQISIQRSHDSLKNYKTILSVADPSAVQNGFADTKAPNDHMFYRLFISLEGGSYLFSEAKRPSVDTAVTAVNPVMEKLKDSLAKKPVIRRPDFIPSFYVYTNKDGYVFINLPDADQKKYHIRFFEDNDAFLFELKNISETGLTLDKANFLHSGWFKFELYNDEKLVEKNKFYLAKEF